MSWELDTNTVIHFFKGRGRVAERLLATPRGSVSVSAIVAHELLVGRERRAEDAAQRAAVERFLALVDVHPFGLEEARTAARIAALLAQAGTPIGPFDTLIAGSALTRGARLVTNNVREFARVPGLEVEDWL